MRACLIAIAALASAISPGDSARAQAQAQVLRTQAGEIAVQTVARGLVHPWALAFLPDGRMLVTERPGRLRLVSREGQISPAITGVPRVYASGQGGLLDLVLDHDFAQNGTIFFCFAEPAEGGARTSLARARLNLGHVPRLEEVRVIFRQEGPLSRGLHFGCRIVVMGDGTLFLTMGDHYGPRDEAQNLGNHLGKIVRLRTDGTVPPDNPFVGRAGAKPEIWSYGHRNSQGAALHPSSGRMWMHEHGARGGDEVNIPEAGKNYGWPVITHGIDYSGAKIGIGPQKEGMEQPIWHWTPSIAPSGMAFYTGDLIPAWKGNLFVGALAGELLSRLELDGEKVVREERIELGRRIRDVRTGPDGALWLLTDEEDGRLLRLAPRG